MCQGSHRWGVARGEAEPRSALLGSWGLLPPPAPTRPAGLRAEGKTDPHQRALGVAKREGPFRVASRGWVEEKGGRAWGRGGLGWQREQRAGRVLSVPMWGRTGSLGAAVVCRGLNAPWLGPGEPWEAIEQCSRFP